MEGGADVGGAGPSGFGVEDEASVYSEVWWRLLSVAMRTFCLSCLEG